MQFDRNDPAYVLALSSSISRAADDLAWFIPEESVRNIGGNMRTMLCEDLGELFSGALEAAA